MKGKAFGLSLFLLVLCRGLVLAPSQLQLLKCKGPNATQGPDPCSSAPPRMGATAEGKGGQRAAGTAGGAWQSPVLLHGEQWGLGMDSGLPGHGEKSGNVSLRLKSHI